MFIRQAIEKFLRQQPQKKPPPHLWVSDLGHHPLQAMNRIVHGIQTEFAIDVKEKMHLGHVLEPDTITALAYTLGHAIPQFPLHNDIWSGYADLVLGHGSAHPILIEHKATGDKGWDYQHALPCSTHLCQLWLYGQLYAAQFHIKPALVLYYRAWGHYAEFAIEVDEKQVVATGQMDGLKSQRQRRIAPQLLRQELEGYYLAQVLPTDLPEAPDTWTYAEDSYDRLRQAVGP